ncbi:hypothetical protein QYF36_011162 [Acer negundo]|nr:hypothetical protein QYF36_011162 [Acer negundo]
MSSSRFSSSLYLLAFAFLLQTAFGADPLFHFCSSSENFTANGPYEANLNKLAGYLYYQAPPTGFAKGTLGENPNQANGLALCRGDVPSSDCKTCVVEASSEIRKRCPKNKAAIIWYDNCLFKYTDKDFFGQIDNQNKFYMWNVKVVSEPEAFNQNTKELLSQLAKEAQATSKLYAVGEVKLGESEKLYGLTQCTRDLSSYESFCVWFGWLFVACRLLERTSLWVFSLLVSLLCSLLAFGQAARVLIVFVLAFGLLACCCSFCLLWLFD